MAGKQRTRWPKRIAPRQEYRHLIDLTDCWTAKAREATAVRQIKLLSSRVIMS
uniref:Uncharacterized protein n=1 Tax=Oryza brachyantha TaxID=4533 RepID=J3MYD5_ORYBR